MSVRDSENNNKGAEDDATDGLLKDAFDIFNRYATKKSMAQGFLDLALLFTNISQMIEIAKKEKDAMYYTGITVISISIVLQIVAGCCIVMVGRMAYYHNKQKDNAVQRLNDVITILLFLISTINVVISMVWVFTDESILIRKCS